MSEFELSTIKNYFQMWADGAGTCLQCGATVHPAYLTTHIVWHKTDAILHDKHKQSIAEIKALWELRGKKDGIS